jgi:hypothetical protein
MARLKRDPERRKAMNGDPLVLLARTRVPLDQPLPSNKDDIVTGEETPGNNRWKDLVGVLENARGCEYVACSRIAENPEVVLFVIGNYSYYEAYCSFLFLFLSPLWSVISIVTLF